GTDDLIDIGNWEVPSGNITMAAWVYVEGISTDGSRIISKTSGTNWPDHTWQMRIIPNGNINTVLTTTIGAQESEGGSGFFLTNQNAWHHVALTYNSSTDLITYYIDGVQVDTDTHSDGGALDTSSGDNIAIGNNPTSAGADSSRAWDGYLDDVRVYDDALTPSEISNLYAATNNFCKNPSQPAGTILFNTDVNAMQYCNGSNWAAMGPSSDGGGGGCSNPTGLQAELRYNFDLNVVQYCEGDEWIAIH
nr:LamG domain-containing protein [Micavibrio sp.]